MKKQSLYPTRKSPRLKNFDYSAARIYHVVTVVDERRHLFGEVINGQAVLNHAGRIAVECIEEIPGHYGNAEIIEYIVMPDHIHLLISLLPISEEETGDDLRKIIAAFKSVVSRRCGHPVWQRSFYDHMIRNERDLQYVLDYIHANPERWDQGTRSGADCPN